MPVDTTTQTDGHHTPGRGAPDADDDRDTIAVHRPPGTRAEVGPAERVRLRAAERTILRARVVALERALERREQRLTNVVEQYERILDDHAGAPQVGQSPPEETDDDADSDGLFARLRSALG